MVLVCACMVKRDEKNEGDTYMVGGSGVYCVIGVGN